MFPGSLEDDARDILAKAAFGLGLAPAIVAERSGVPQATVMAAMGKNAYPALADIPDDQWRAIARALQLGPEALLAIARGRYRPTVVLPEGLVCVATRQRQLEVNAWILADPSSGEAILIDTGADARPLLGHLAARQWKARLLLLTHDHPDHVAALPELLSALPDLRVYSPPLDLIPGTSPLPESGKISSSLGEISCLPTPGHTDGGTTYHVTCARISIAFVGDALFAGSIGGPRYSYPEALRSLRASVFSLPPETILCPGHGPATTIALESANNPFLVTSL
jgi:glyoxylase-like metal-dependent hydrolase (beta-lactamase superfamily II)